MPDELLAAAARHSKAGASSTSTEEDVAAKIKLLSPERRDEYLVRLVHNEPGLSRLLVRELRELGKDRTRATPSMGEQVTYATLLAESKAIQAQLDREQREQERLAHLRHLQDIHNHQDVYWRQVELATARAAGAAYDEAVRLLVELRDAAKQFNESQKFQEHFRAWVEPLMHRPALIKRLQTHGFTLPGA